MGLLDGLLGASFDDPRTAATLQLAQGLLSSPKALQGLSGGLLGYQQSMQESKRQKQAEEMRAMQLQAMQLQQQQAQRAAKQAEAQDQFRASIPSPMMQASQAALAGGGGPTMANASRMQPVDPNAQMMHGALQAGLVDPVAYINSQRKDNTPMKLGAGEALIDPKTFKPIYTNPKEDTTDPFVRLLKQSGIDPMSPQGQSLLQQRLRKEATHTPGTNVNINTAKPLLNTVAEGLGKQLDAGLEGARSAQGAIQTAHSLKSAIDSGKVISGPGATFRIAGLQIGQLLGIGGKDAAETLANTRQAMQSMAQAELDAAAQMKGQGALTEAERAILRRAATGDIDGLTGPEIRLMADISERNARRKISGHKGNVARLKAMPDAAPIMPFYDIEEPAPYAAPGSAAGVRRYNPATGKLE
jgi:hypothetical protein